MIINIYKVINEWLLNTKYSANTIRAYRSDLYSFFKKTNLKDVNSITLNDLKSWLALRRKDGLSIQSNQRALFTIRSFFLYLKNEYKFSIPDMYSINIKSQKKHTKIFSSSMEVKWKTLEDFFKKRDYLIYYFFYELKIKCSCIISLRTKDFVAEKLIINKKQIFLEAKINDILNQYIKENPYKTQFIFTNNDGNKLNITNIKLIIKKYKEQPVDNLLIHYAKYHPLFK